MVIPFALIFVFQSLWRPVSCASLTWSRTITKGTYGKGSSFCNSYIKFRQSLVGFDAKAFVVSAGTTVRSCRNAKLAKQLTDAFSSGRTIQIVCDGTTWKIGVCGPHGIEISSTVGSSTKHCTCGGRPYIDVSMRPCHSSYNWGSEKGNSCGSITKKFSITVQTPTKTPTTHPTSPTDNPTTNPTSSPTKTPTSSPTENPSTNPTSSPTKTPTTHPTSSPTDPPTTRPTTLIPTSSPTSNPTDAALFNDFVIIDQNGDRSLNYEEIAFAIADGNKDEKISPEEYLAARGDRIFVDTSYTVMMTSKDVSFITDFHIIDRNGDGFLNYDEIAYAISDTNKDGKLSFEEYDAARADRIFIDSSYMSE